MSAAWAFLMGVVSSRLVESMVTVEVTAVAEVAATVMAVVPLTPVEAESKVTVVVPPTSIVEERGEAGLLVSPSRVLGLFAQLEPEEVSGAVAGTEAEEALVSRGIPVVDLSSNVEEDTEVLPSATLLPQSGQWSGCRMMLRWLDLPASQWRLATWCGLTQASQEKPDSSFVIGRRWGSGTCSGRVGSQWGLTSPLLRQS